MKRFTKIPAIAACILLTLLLSACSLLGGAASERAAENDAVSQGADFGDIVLAEGIGANNEPIAIATTFSSSQDFIYLVAEANYLQAGTTMFSRWSFEGEPFEDSTAVAADRDYEDTYVEFHLENLTTSMETGNYSVQLFVNGNPNETIEFTID
jgi:hypothetical protein